MFDIRTGKVEKSISANQSKEAVHSVAFLGEGD
jgi:hypothetical protein